MKIYEVVKLFDEILISKGLYRSKEDAVTAMNQFADYETERQLYIMDSNRWGVDRYFGTNDAGLPYWVLYVVDHDDDREEESCRMLIRERELE